MKLLRSHGMKSLFVLKYASLRLSPCDLSNQTALDKRSSALRGTMKTCKKCKQEKAESEFSKRKSSSDGYQSYCKDCMKASVDYLMLTYGLTAEQYKGMYDAQGGKCAICKKKSNKLFVDHNHKSGKVRALLCHRCNTGIGYFSDNPETLRRAANYVIDAEIDEQTMEVLQNVL